MDRPRLTPVARPAGRRPADRGFALLIVLWAIVLLALLATRIAATGRGEMQLAANLRNAAVAEAAADAAVYETAYYLSEVGQARWGLEGPHHIALPQASVDFRVEDLAGRINVNTAWPELLAALLAGLGATPGQAASLAAAIVDWRSPGEGASPHGAKAAEYAAAGRAYAPPGEAFREPDELAGVLGMTPALLALLLPHVAVWGESDPDPSCAGPVVRSALAAVGIRASGRRAEPEWLTVAVTAEAAGPGGARFVRSAVVQVALAAGGEPWRILAWAAGP